MIVRNPITQGDTVEVVGKYLFRNSTGERFWIKGIAFPTPPLVVSKNSEPVDSSSLQYNAAGWNAVLEQLANDLEINAVRVYRMNCTLDYTPFFKRAAELGIYVIVPLTSASGDGVLDRDLAAPACYTPELFQYGVSCLEQYLRHPNVLAAMLGNEVMNSLLTWKSAPCVRAYGRDLKAYMSTYNSKKTAYRRRSVPLLYAAQHDSPDASVLPEVAMKLTANYLSCVDSNTENGADTEPSVDLYGINVESWCSSMQTFEFNEDGVSETAYHALWRTLTNTSIPLLFSEAGCSKELFNRDNGLARFVRDWRQIPVILNNMSSVFSGFCAYAYDGNPLFRMMDGQELWDGVHVLQPSQDYENFRQQLHDATLELMQDKGAMLVDQAMASVRLSTCTDATDDVERFWKVQLLPLTALPSYVSTEMGDLLVRGTPTTNNASFPIFPFKISIFGWATISLALVVCGIAVVRRLKPFKKVQGETQHQSQQQQFLLLQQRSHPPSYGTEAR